MRRRLPAFAMFAMLAVSRSAAATEPPICVVDRHEGFSDADAAGVEQVVCNAVRESGKTASYRIQLGKLGEKVVLTVAVDGGREKQAVLSDLGEVTVAAPRLVEAAAEKKPFAETAKVDNLIGEETRPLRKRPSRSNGWFGLLGVTSGGASGGGMNLGFSVGSEQWSFVGELRLGGEAFNKPVMIAGVIVTLGAMKMDPKGELSYASLNGGLRHHFFASDISPFAGCGFGADYIARQQTYPAAFAGGAEQHTVDGKSGLAGYAEVGLDFLRTHQHGGAVTVRMDVPAFAVNQRRPDAQAGGGYLVARNQSPVFAAGLAFRF